MLRTFSLGVLFGYFLTRVGATRYDVIARMFLFEDPHLAIVMAVAIGTAGVGLALVRRFGIPTLDGGVPPVDVPATPSPTLVPGALLFGVGWGLTGACPGTALAALGEGRLVGLYVAGGIFLGSWLYARKERCAGA